MISIFMALAPRDYHFLAISITTHFFVIMRLGDERARHFSEHATSSVKEILNSVPVVGEMFSMLTSTVPRLFHRNEVLDLKYYNVIYKILWHRSEQE